MDSDTNGLRRQRLNEYWLRVMEVLALEARYQTARAAVEGTMAALVDGREADGLNGAIARNLPDMEWLDARYDGMQALGHETTDAEMALFGPRLDALADTYRRGIRLYGGDA